MTNSVAHFTTGVTAEHFDLSVSLAVIYDYPVKWKPASHDIDLSESYDRLHSDQTIFVFAKHRFRGACQAISRASETVGFSPSLIDIWCISCRLPPRSVRTRGGGGGARMAEVRAATADCHRFLHQRHGLGGCVCTGSPASRCSPFSGTTGVPHQPRAGS